MPVLNGTQAFADAGSVVGGSVVAITSLFGEELLKRAERAWFTAAVQPINYRYSGTNPTTGGTGGHQLPVAGATNVDGNYNIRNLKWIRSDTTDGAIFVTLEE